MSRIVKIFSFLTLRIVEIIKMSNTSGQTFPIVSQPYQFMPAATLKPIKNFRPN